jgi:hypothetical protein
MQLDSKMGSLFEGKIGQKGLRFSTTVENSLQIHPFYAKQSQYLKQQNESKLFCNNELQDIGHLVIQTKQSQFKPN